MIAQLPMELNNMPIKKQEEKCKHDWEYVECECPVCHKGGHEQCGVCYEIRE